jgi:hypothetical protein
MLAHAAHYMWFIWSVDPDDETDPRNRERADAAAIDTARYIGEFMRSRGQKTACGGAAAAAGVGNGPDAAGKRAAWH